MKDAPVKSAKPGTYETKIDRYRVEFDTEALPIPCIITWKQYSASLAVLSDYGCLSGGDKEHAVPARVIGEIELWASNNGY